MRPRERRIRFAQPRRPLPGAPKMSGETVLHEHLWDRSPFVCPVRGRREHEEQIVVNTRAVYPGSGRGGRVKPYSCLVCIELESSGASRTSYTERMSDLGPQCPNREPNPQPPLRCSRASFYSAKGSPTGVNV